MAARRRAARATVVASTGLAGLMVVIAAWFVAGPAGLGPGTRGTPGPDGQAGERRVLVIAHRGNSVQAPEDTLASIEEAFSLGADMVEVDVHLSRDGVPVVIHDETVERTTDGRGSVADMTVAQLKALDAGAWRHPRYAGERVPTLAEALRAIRGRGRLLLDLKVEGMGRAIAAVLHEAGLPASVVAVGTWTGPQAADAVAHLGGAMILATNGPPAASDPDFFARQRARGIGGFEIGHGWSAAFVAAAHAHGMPVYAYTINDAPTMRELIALGIDGIETDDPGLALEILRERSGRR